MAAEKVKINRAPVMTLWATVVAEHMGFDRAAALTMAKVVTGLNAQAKGQRLGIFEPNAGKEDVKKLSELPAGEGFSVALLGRAVPVTNTPDGIRATDEGKPLSPASVQKYLDGKFGADLPEVEAAMNTLASSLTPEQLYNDAYHYYEKFRPEIPAGVTGWGAKGELDPDFIRSLATKKR